MKSALDCDERTLKSYAQDLARELRAGDWVFLEGPMGAGKSTFARLLLESLGVSRRTEGSPTFAIAHEYPLKDSVTAVHMDLYRLKSEEELEEAGVVATLWERPECLVICEWASQWPEFWKSVEKSAREGRRAWRVDLQFVEDPLRRSVLLQQL